MQEPGPWTWKIIQPFAISPAKSRIQKVGSQPERSWTAPGYVASVWIVVPMMLGWPKSRALGSPRNVRKLSEIIPGPNVEDALTEEDKTEGYIRACQAKVRGDVRVGA